MGRPPKATSTDIQKEIKSRSVPPGCEGMELFTAINARGDVMEYPLRIRQDGVVYIKTAWAKFERIDDSKYGLMFASKDAQKVVIFLSNSKRLEDDDFKFKTSTPGNLAFANNRIGTALKLKKGWHLYKVAEIDREANYEGLNCVKVTFAYHHHEEISRYNMHNRGKGKDEG